jgi:hypothetical protein
VLKVGRGGVCWFADFWNPTGGAILRWLWEWWSGVHFWSNEELGWIRYVLLFFVLKIFCFKNIASDGPKLCGLFLKKK